MGCAARGSDLSDQATAILRILRRRRSLLRGLVLLHAFDLATSLVVATFAPWFACASCLFGVTLFVLYLIGDTALVGRWRRGILRPWVAGKLNIGVLAGALCTLANMPQATLREMIRSLPALAPLRDRDLTSVQREALAAFSDWCWTSETMAALAPGVAVGAGSAIVATVLLGLTPSAATLARGCTAVVAMSGVVRIVPPALARRRLLRTFVAAAPATRPALLVLISELDWSSTTEVRQRRLRALERAAGGPRARGLFFSR